MPVPEGDVASHGEGERTRYDHEDMEADADRRTNDLIERRRERQQEEGEAYGLGDQDWAERDFADGDAGDAADGGSGDAPKDAMPEDQKIDGDSAEECINNFRKGAVSGLRAHASDEKTIADRRAEAERLEAEAAALEADDEHMARLREAEARQADAADAVEQAHEDRVAAGHAMGGARRSANHWQNACDEAPTPPGPSQALRDRRDQSAAHLATIEQQHADAHAREAAAREELESANRSRGSMPDPERMREEARQLDCLADQGEAIRNSGDPNHGRDGVVPRHGSAPRSAPASDQGDDDDV
jgi:hypothetical protein